MKTCSVKRSVRERDGYRCVDCGVHQDMHIRIAVKCVPTTWEKVIGDVGGADHHWQLVVE